MANDSVAVYPNAECIRIDEAGSATWKVTLTPGYVVTVKTMHWASQRAAIRSAEAQAAMISRWPNCIGNQSF